MKYQIYLKKIIENEELSRAEIIHQYLNCSTWECQDDILEFETNDYEESLKRFESLLEKPHWDCYNKGFEYTIVELLKDDESFDIDSIGFDLDNKFKEMYDYWNLENYTNEELENLLKFLEKNEDNFVGNFEDEFGEINAELNFRRKYENK